MNWFTRRRRRPRPPRRLPRRELAPVEDIIEQGLLVADVASRMTVKNAIIMNALKNRAAYDSQQIRDMVRDSLIELAEERERDARHIERVRGEIRNTGRSAWSESEYGNDDSRTLRHRQEVYEGVATELRERADDPEYIDRTAERARVAAWEEIGDSLKERATHPYYAGNASPDYLQQRESRIQLLIERDITELVSQLAQSREASSESEESGQTPPSAKPKRGLRKSHSR